MYTVTFRLSVQSMKRSVDDLPLPNTNPTSNDSGSSGRSSSCSVTLLKTLRKIISTFFSRLHRMWEMALSKFTLFEDTASDELQMQQRNITLKPVTFHEKRGQNVRLWINRQIAFRSYDFCNGYVFIREPVVGNRFFLVVQILETDQNFLGSMTFGMTTENPDFIHPELFPADLKQLDDGRSYLVCANVTKSSTGSTVLIFYSNENHEMRVKMNDNSDQKLFPITKDTPYWCFFDVFGSTRKIRAYFAEKSEVSLLGLLTQQPEFIDDPMSLSNVAEIETEESNITPDNDSSTLTLNCYITKNKIIYKPVGTNLLELGQLRDPSVGFCVECFENLHDDCILYPCGDSILCYNCAVALQHDQEPGHCPKCLSVVKNVTRIFHA